MQAEYVQPHSTVATMADEYAKALTIRAEIEVQKMRLDNSQKVQNTCRI
jgi:hypothetical protein